MTPYRTGWVHGGNDLDLIVQVDELQVVIIEPSVRDELLQEGDQLNGLIFIRFR